MRLLTPVLVGPGYLLTIRTRQRLDPEHQRSKRIMVNLCLASANVFSAAMILPLMVGESDVPHPIQTIAFAANVASAVFNFGVFIRCGRAVP